MAVLDSNGRKVGLIMDDGMDSSRRQMETVVGTRRVLFWADGGWMVNKNGQMDAGPRVTFEN